MKNHPLKKYRAGKNFTLEEMAKILEVSIASVSRIERGIQGVTPELAAHIEKITNGQITRMELLYPEKEP